MNIKATILLACAMLVHESWCRDALSSPVSRGSVAAARVSPDDLATDGSCDEPAWQTATPRGEFVQRQPLDGHPPSEATQVRFAYDDDALYLCVELLDRKPRQIQARLTRRDQNSTSDWVHLWLATQGGERTAYRFSVNAAGVKQDTRLLDGTNEDVAYDAIWDAAVRTHRRGWTAELRIPFRQVFYTPHAPQLRVQVGRVLSRKNETSFLFPYPRAATQPIRYFGSLRGLRDLPAPVHAELLPYTRAGFRLEPGRRTAELAFGTDAKLGLSPALSLSLSLNPDFGEVEADPSELNLTERETYLTERRPFFLHGKETVDYSLRYNNQRDTLYYSRRIGQQPQVSLDVDDEDILDFPRETRLLAATKFTGTTSDNVSVGIVQAVTARERARVQTPEGVHAPAVAPPTNLGVARGTKELGDGRTMLGGMVTGVTRHLGAELDSHLPHSAATGGLDFRHREGDLVVLGKWFASHVAGSAESIRRLQESSVRYWQRPDADYLGYDPNRQSLAGWGATLVGAQESGSTWRGYWGGTVISPGFEPNDLGFLQHADDLAAFGGVEYREDQPSSWSRSYTVGANTWLNTTFGGERTASGANLITTLTSNSLHDIAAGVQRDGERTDPWHLRGGPALRIPGKNSCWVRGGTDDRRAVAIGASASAGRQDGGVAGWLNGSVTLRVRPSSPIQVEISPWLQRNFSAFAFVNGDDPERSVIAELYRDTAQLKVQSSWALDPDLTLQVYLMPYFSAGQYYTFQVVVDPRAERYIDRFAPTDYDGDVRFVFAQVRSNAVLRWEYLPGSAVLLVWSREQGQSRDDRGHWQPVRDWEYLWSAPATDIVMLKLTQWFAQ